MFFVQNNELIVYNNDMNRSDIGVKLKNLRIKSGKSQREVYEHFKIPQSTFSSWERGISEPSIQMVVRLCDYYGVDDILTELGFRTPEQEVGELTKAEERLVNSYRKLSKFSRETLSIIADRMAEDYRNVQPTLIPRPIYEQSASAGPGTFLDSNRYTMVEFPEEVVPNEATFGVRVSGDSMEPDYPDNSIVFVKQMKNLRPGDVGIFTLNGEGFIKELGENASLVSRNKSYEDIQIKEYDDLRVIGKVIGEPYLEK